MLLQKLRLQQGWSQDQLADLAGVSVRTVQRLEQGKPASTETLKCLGAVLNVSFHDLKPMEQENTIMIEQSNAYEQKLSNDEALALRYARKLRGFYAHVAQYCSVITILAVINYFTSDYPWVLWTAFGWGTGVLVHGLMVHNRIPFLGADWERRVVEQRLGRKL
jgi:transcriptional regulator with XRE-family HTH domain